LNIEPQNKEYRPPKEGFFHFQGITLPGPQGRKCVQGNATLQQSIFLVQYPTFK
jgi:hypothetical protein